MKKILSKLLPSLILIFFLCVIVVNLYSATIIAVKNGSAVDTTVWDLSRVPQDGDDVDVGSFTVQLIGLPRFPATGSFNSVTGSDGGKFYSYQEGGQLFTAIMHAPMIVQYATTTESVAITVGSLINEGFIGNSSQNTISFTGPGILSLVGRFSAGIYGSGVSLGSYGSVNVDGIIQGADVGYGYIQSFGLYNSSDANVTFSPTTILINGVYSPAYKGKAPAWQPTTGYVQYYTGTSFGQPANTNFPVQLPASSIKYGVPSGNVTGTYQGRPGFGGNQ